MVTSVFSSSWCHCLISKESRGFPRPATVVSAICWYSYKLPRVRQAMLHVLPS
jgi:hypothetical protein